MSKPKRKKKEERETVQMQTAASKRTDSVGGSQSGKNGLRMYIANVNATIACKRIY